MSLALIAAVIFVPEDYQVPAVRAIFLVVVCLLPAILYYLFITTAKFSILNEFVTNLDRLGLVPRPGNVEGASDFSVFAQKDLAAARRLETYIRKFEAVYGALPSVPRDRLVKNYDPSSVFESDSKERPGVSGLAKGIRTAFALVDIHRNLTLPNERELFEKILGGTGYSPVRSLVESLETNPNLRLIQTWRNTDRKRAGDDRRA